MGSWHDWALTLSVLIPLVGAIVIAILPSAADQAAKGLAVAFSLATFLVTLGILFSYDFSGDKTGYQFELSRRWITTVNSNYHLGIDGVALPLVVLTGLLTFLCAIYSVKIIPAPGKAKALMSLMLLLEVGMMGTFISLDLILFFVFWELVLVPMYFMIAIWGGPNRSYASVKFFLYTLFGSAFMLLGFLAMYANGGQTFDMVALAKVGAAGTGGGFGQGFQYLAYLALFLGFAIKVPMWPFHTWLPDAHTEAPTIGSVLLAGIMLKMGTYGFIRIANPMLPEGAKAFAPYVGILAVIAIIYGALCCLAQREIKRMIAFSSVGHMGFVMLGLATLTPTGTNAAVFGMVAHGVVTGMLFFIVGSVKERYHTGEIAEIGGGMLAKMPYMASLLTFVAIASLGLPGLAGFWGEIFALQAAFNPAAGLNVALFRGLMVGGAVGTILTAGYFLWLLQRVNQGVVPERWRSERFSDVKGIELAAWTPLLVLILALGVYPRFIFGVTNTAMHTVLAPFMSK
jgi:NADH-quinone oxidoreductase subunit M